MGSTKALSAEQQIPPKHHHGTARQKCLPTLQAQPLILSKNEQEWCFWQVWRTMIFSCLAPAVTASLLERRIWQVRALCKRISRLYMCCRVAILPGHQETGALGTNVSLAAGTGSLVRIDLDLASLTPAALQASAQGTCTLHECLQQQPWRLQFKVPSLPSLCLYCKHLLPTDHQSHMLVPAAPTSDADFQLQLAPCMQKRHATRAELRAQLTLWALPCKNSTDSSLSLVM